MFENILLAGLPEWDKLHPLVVHIPIGSLVIAPIFIIMGLVNIKSNRTFLNSAAVLIIIGTIGTFVAISTGEAAEERAKKVTEAANTLEEHEDSAKTLRYTFVLLSVFYTGIVFLPKLLKNKYSLKIDISLQVIYILIYSYGLLLLWKTAELGGELVHKYDITGT